MSLALALLLAPFAHADDAVDVQLEWVEPTCDQAALRTAVAVRAASMCGATRPARLTFQYQPSTTPLGCHVWAHAWCPDAKATPYQAPGAVQVPTVYGDVDFKGTALPLDPGAHELVRIPIREGGDWKQKIGSVRVPAGWTLRLCTEAGGAGRCSDFTGDAPRLGEAYVGNDAAAYALVAKGTLPPAYACPRVFEHDGFGGKFLEVCAHQPSLVGGGWNDSVSSVLVPGGWSVELCANPDGAAPCVTLTCDARSLNGTAVGADKASSIRVTRPR